MSIQLINIGSYANDGTGEDLRTAFDKINENFIFLNNLSGVLAGDQSPTLSAPLNLNSYRVYGGDMQTTIYGYDFVLLNTLVEQAITSNSITIDMGTINAPSDVNIDMGTFTAPVANKLDFGLIT